MNQWGQIRAWHFVRTFTRGIGMAISVCGRTISGGGYVSQPPIGALICRKCQQIVWNRV